MTSFQRGLNISHVYATHAQIASLESAVDIAEGALRIAQDNHNHKDANRRWKAVARAYLNRACELASVPLTQYYTESSSGDLDLTWITYRPEAVPWSVNCDPAAMVYLGSVDNLTEDQARSRAMGW